jgi:hypothetical protein
LTGLQGQDNVVDKAFLPCAEIVDLFCHLGDFVALSQIFNHLLTHWCTGDEQDGGIDTGLGDFLPDCG